MQVNVPETEAVRAPPRQEQWLERLGTAFESLWGKSLWRHRLPRNQSAPSPWKSCPQLIGSRRSSFRSSRYWLRCCQWRFLRCSSWRSWRRSRDGRGLRGRCEIAAPARKPRGYWAKAKMHPTPCQLQLRPQWTSVLFRSSTLLLFIFSSILFLFSILTIDVLRSLTCVVIWCSKCEYYSSIELDIKCIEIYSIIKETFLVNESS